MKQFLILQLLLLTFNVTWAQSKKPSKSVIKYEAFDYLQDTAAVYTNKMPINSRVGIKIVNINKKLVDINKDIQKTTFNEEMPKLFETFSKSTAPSASSAGAGLAEADLDLLSESDILNSNIPDTIKVKLAALQTAYTNVGKEIIKLQNLLKAYGADYTHVKAVVQYHSDLTLLQNSCNRSFNDILNDVNTLTFTIFSNISMGITQQDRALLLVRSEYIQNKGIINRYIAKVADDAQTHYNDISAGFLPSSLDKLSNNVEKIKISLKALESTLKQTRTPNENTKRLLEKISMEKLNFKLEQDFVDLKSNYSKFDFAKLQKDIDAFSSSGKTDLFKTYDYFNESNFTYYVNPESIDKDLTVMSVSITPKENVPCSPIPRSYELRIRSRSGIKIDFSTGLFGNFGGNNFIDQSYKYDSVAGQPDKYLIVRNKTKNSIFPSVGALMHIYWRNGKDFHFSGAFGISTKDLEKINYHMGGSLIFGYSQRFILSGGVTLTKATLIDDKYEVGQIINKQGAPESIPTSNFSRFGYFLSFTYNLTSK